MSHAATPSGPPLRVTGRARFGVLAALVILPSLLGAITCLPGATTQAHASEAKTLVPQDPKAMRAYKDLVKGAQAYFDLNERIWKGRKAFTTQIQALAKKGVYVLKDLPFLRWLVAQARSFKPQMDDKKWRKFEGLREVAANAFTGFELKNETLWMHVREPAKYPKRNKDLERFPRPGPWPTIYSLHTKAQAGAEGTGERLIKAFWHKSACPDIFEQWFVAVPVAAGGKFSDGDQIRADRAMLPLAKLWEHYHIDFDRIVLEGEQDALRMLAGQPVFFAGAILRNGILDSDLLKASVVNFAHVPLFVVDKPGLGQGAARGRSSQR